MGLEKDVMHVVIKLPFKRPSDFVEPPPVVWTDDMEQQLWKHMNQKHTDWNYIAEQFGVPTSYLVRHAAFMYETQLRGIQQQLRLSEAGKPTAISSSPPPAVMTSTSSSNTQRSSRPSSQRQVQPISSSSSSSRTQQLLRSSTVWKDALEQQNDEYTPTSPPPATTQSVTNTNEPMAGSASSTSLRNSPNSKQTYDQPSTTTHRSITSSSMDIEATAMATAPINRYQQSIHDDSMILSTISNISPRNKSINSGNNLNDTDLTPLSDHEEHSNYASPQQNALYRSSDAHITSQPSDRSIRKDVNHGSNELTSRYYGKEHNEGGLNDMDDNDHDTNDVDHTGIDGGDLTNNSSHNDADDDDDDGFSRHFENMKLQLEEPAFLPSRKMEGSQLLNSLRASSHQSRSALSSPAFSSSKSTSPLSTSQRYSPHTILAASILREPSASPSLPSSSSPLQQETANLSNNTSEQDATQVSMETERQNISEESSNENKSTNSNNDDASDTSSNDKAKMVFGPNLSRVPTTQPSDESNKDANSALNSVGSSFSDLSDYSVTQSAMEDAFMSKLNNGSKMSSLAFSRKDT